MSIKKLSFITPLLKGKKYKLLKNYSHTLILKNQDKINLASNVGPNEEQEDTITVLEHQGYILLLVADGMGGTTNGNEASYFIAKKIQRWFRTLTKQKLDELDEKNIKKYLTRVINEMKDNDFPQQAGTTLNMSIIGPQKTLIINIGDSRTYSIKDNKITIRTEDDSLAFKEFNPKTKKERDELRFYRLNNIITNCIEMRSIAKINVSVVNNEKYDVLCHVTDGVSDILNEDKIKSYSLTENPAETLVEKAVSARPKHKRYAKPNFLECIKPHDNASAVVYTKKRTKNN